MISANRQRTLPLVVAAGTALVIAVLGGTMTDIGPWYQTLEKPSWQPPDWLFAPAWTCIYALIVLAFVNAWFKTEDRATKK